LESVEDEYEYVEVDEPEKLNFTLIDKPKKDKLVIGDHNMTKIIKHIENRMVQ
jgi:hypothetical protein